MNLRDRLRALVESWRPTQAATNYSPLNDRPAPLRGMTAPRLASILASAEQGWTQDLFDVYRALFGADAHLMAEGQKRVLAVLAEPWAINPASKSAADVKTADLIRAHLKQLPGFLDFCAHLLRSTLWPVSICERLYTAATAGSGLTIGIGELIIVPDALLDYSDGTLRLVKTSPEGRPIGEKFVPDPDRYIVHRAHFLSEPDQFGGPMRAVVWWSYLKLLAREWWTRSLDQFGQPFLVGKFDRGDHESRRVLESAFEWSKKIKGVVINREASVELQQAQMAGNAGAFESFMAYADAQISKLLIGGSLSADAKSTGLGNGQAGMQNDVRNDLRKADARRLSQTIRDQILLPLCQANNLPGACPDIVFGGEEEEDLKSFAETLKTLKDAGFSIAAASLPELSDRFGVELELPAPPPQLPPGGALPPGQPGVDPVKAAALKKLLSLAADPSAGGDDLTAALDSIARKAAPGLAASWKDQLGPIHAAVMAATDRADLAARLKALSIIVPGRGAEIVEGALVAAMLNGGDGIE